MALSQLEDWVSGNGLGFLRESKESSQKSSLDPAATPLLAHVIEAANVFLVDKNVPYLHTFCFLLLFPDHSSSCRSSYRKNTSALLFPISVSKRIFFSLLLRNSLLMHILHLPPSSLDAMQISRLLDMFVQDELSPAPIPGTAKSALLSMKTRLPTKTTNLTLDTTYLLSTAAAKEKEKW